VLGGRYALRVAITNHRSRREDFDFFVDAVLAAGAELTEVRSEPQALSSRAPVSS
jgi:hypothetical protein